MPRWAAACNGIQYSPIGRGYDPANSGCCIPRRRLHRPVLRVHPRAAASKSDTSFYPSPSPPSSLIVPFCRIAESIREESRFIPAAPRLVDVPSYKIANMDLVTFKREFFYVIRSTCMSVSTQGYFIVVNNCIMRSCWNWSAVIFKCI